MLGSQPPSPLPFSHSSAGELGFGKGQARLSQPMGQCSVLLRPPSGLIRPPGAQGLTNIVRASSLVGDATPVLCQLFLRENRAAHLASCSWLVVRGGHLHAPATVTACHCAFEVVPDFPVCLKSLAVYAAAGPASPPAGPFHDGASRQGLGETATRSGGRVGRRS